MNPGPALLLTLLACPHQPTPTPTLLAEDIEFWKSHAGHSEMLRLEVSGRFVWEERVGGATADRDQALQQELARGVFEIAHPGVVVFSFGSAVEAWLFVRHAERTELVPVQSLPTICDAWDLGGFPVRRLAVPGHPLPVALDLDDVCLANFRHAADR